MPPRVRSNSITSDHSSVLSSPTVHHHYHDFTNIINHQSIEAAPNSNKHQKSTWLLVRLLDALIYIASEYSKTLIRELLLLFGYLLHLLVSFILYVFHRPGRYDETLLAQQKAFPKRVASAASLVHLDMSKLSNDDDSSVGVGIFGRYDDEMSLTGQNTFSEDHGNDSINIKHLTEKKKVRFDKSDHLINTNVRKNSFSLNVTKEDDTSPTIDTGSILQQHPIPTTNLFPTSTSSHVMIGKNSFRKILESSLKLKKISGVGHLISPNTLSTSCVTPTQVESSGANVISEYPPVESSTASMVDSEWTDYENLDANFDYDFEDDVREDIKLIYEEKRLGARILNFIGEMFMWFIMLIIYLPSLFKSPINSKKASIEADKVHLYEKKSTGLFEDLIDTVFECIDLLAKSARLFIRFKMRDYFKTIKECVLLFRLSNFLSTRGIDDRSISQVIIDNGFKSKSYICSTEDGYKVELNRIPNAQSKTAVYFQHGILDSGFTWIGSSPNVGLACAANGYDVFLGNLRGYGLAKCHLKHARENVTSREYWDFSINEHAFYDVKSFVKKIRDIKKKELGTSNFKLVVVAHSMGAACILAYMSWCKAHNQEHYIDKAILLSPAGNHQKIPTLLYYLSFTVPLIRKLPFWNYFGFTSKTMKILVAKLIQDINNHKATRSLFSAFASALVLGGKTQNNPFQYVHNLVYHTFNATSVKVVEHLIQMSTSGRFLAYDYGPEINKKVYGSKKPFDFFDYYDKLNIPIYIVYADDDRVIPKQCILRHYKELRKYHPETSFAKKFKDLGHLELTLSSNDRVIQYILKVLGQDQDGQNK
nr:unnamed protein product [Naegleria fowleri]